MKKLFIIPILIAFAFSQLQSKQASYIIYTDKKVYPNVSIESAYKEEVEVYDRNLDTKVNIPISEIKSLNQNGWRPNIFVTIIGTAAGAGCGAIAALYAGMMFHGQGATANVAPIVAFGGSVMLGYKLGSSIFKREYKVVEFDGWTLDEKRNYLVKSKVKQLSGPQKFLQHLRGFSLRIN